MYETVAPNFEAGLWGGMAAPSNTPPVTVARLQLSLDKYFNVAEGRAKLDAQGGNQPVSIPPEEYDAYLKSKLGRWSDETRQAGIKPACFGTRYQS